MDIRQWTSDNGHRTLDIGQWTSDNGQRTIYIYLSNISQYHIKAHERAGDTCEDFIFYHLMESCSSIILKIFELVVLLLWGLLLNSDSLQFGYKAKTSTTHCTWMVSEVVHHMRRGGINPVVTVLDCSKAFDKCKFSLLFKRLLDKGLPPIVVRVLVFVYIEQYGWVSGGMPSLV